jgi:hypothetical protein
MDIETKLDEQLSLNRLLKLEIAKFWVSKREFDLLRDDFQHIKNKGRIDIKLSDLHKDYFGWVSDNDRKGYQMGRRRKKDRI